MHGPLSEKVPAKAIELANAEVEQQLKETPHAWRPYSRCCYAVGIAGLLHRLGLLSQTDAKVFFALYSALIFADSPSFTPPTFSGPPLTLSLIDSVGYSPKFSLPMLYFVDSPKFYAANVLRYTVPKLRLWARMIANGVHESTEEPPNVPIITGVLPKKCFKTESVHDVVVDAAKAIAQVFTVPQKGEQKGQSPAKGNLNSSCNSVNISPSRLADVRMKHYEQLRYIHKLYDDGILNDEEFGEQNLKILQVLRSL